MSSNVAEVGIVGAGPIGIEMAVALKKAGISYVHWDAQQIGYTVSWYAPQTRFFSSNERIAIAGVPLETPDQTKCTREQYLAYLRSIVRQFKLEVKTYESVTSIAASSGQIEVRTQSRGGPRSYAVRHLILATGGTAVPRRMDVPGAKLPHVSHYFQDPHTYFNQRLLIVGGRNSAVEAALRCHHAGASVALSYRRETLPAKSIKYWLAPEISGLIKSDAIRFHGSTEVAAITPTHVTLRRAGDGQTYAVAADFVLLLIGYEADLSLCRMAGVTLTGDNVPTYDSATMETDVPGVYIAGTVMGGTQAEYSVFLENCHVHVDRIMASLTGSARRATGATVEYLQPES